MNALTFARSMPLSRQQCVGLDACAGGRNAQSEIDLVAAGDQCSIAAANHHCGAVRKDADQSDSAPDGAVMHAGGKAEIAN